MCSIHEIMNTADVLWAPWQEIYLASFPPNERMTLSYFEQILVRREVDDPLHILAMMDPEDQNHVVCIAHYEVDIARKLSILRYLATGAGLRGNGFGAEMYLAVRDRSRTDGADLMVFEVEIPAVTAGTSPETAELARRRIQWYGRLGAVMVHGIRYTLDVDSTDERTPMYLMVHTDSEMDPEEIYGRLSAFFGSSVQRIGPVSVGGYAG